MPEVPEPAEMRFAEFVAKLIAETFEAVTAAQSDQSERVNQMAQAARLATEEFSRRFVPDAAIDEELARLFPTGRKGQSHTIAPGARLRVGSGRGEGTALLSGLLGEKRLTPQVKGSGGRLVRLRPADVTRIRQGVRLRLVSARLASLRESVQRGVPRVLVDSGKITAKLTFRIMDLAEAARPAVRRRLAAPLRSLGDTLPNVRVVVRQTEPTDVPARSDASVAGEVDIPERLRPDQPEGRILGRAAPHR